MEITHRYTGAVLLTVESLREADLRGADLYRADLYRADLRGVDLRGVDLRGAYLYRADLRGADLYRADLREANLREADLREADLHEADLRGADLREANLRCLGDMKIIHTMQLDTWEIGFTREFMTIGCQNHTIEQWRNFTDQEIMKMEGGALLWWKKWKTHIFMIIGEINGNKT